MSHSPTNKTIIITPYAGAYLQVRVLVHTHHITVYALLENNVMRDHLCLLVQPSNLIEITHRMPTGLGVVLSNFCLEPARCISALVIRLIPPAHQICSSYSSTAPTPSQVCTPTPTACWFRQQTPPTHIHTQFRCVQSSSYACTRLRHHTDGQFRNSYSLTHTIIPKHRKWGRCPVLGCDWCRGVMTTDVLGRDCCKQDEMLSRHWLDEVYGVRLDLACCILIFATLQTACRSCADFR